MRSLENISISSNPECFLNYFHNERQLPLHEPSIPEWQLLKPVRSAIIAFVSKVAFSSFHNRAAPDFLKPHQERPIRRNPQGKWAGSSGFSGSTVRKDRLIPGSKCPGPWPRLQLYYSRVHSSVIRRFLDLQFVNPDWAPVAFLFSLFIFNISVW